MLKTLSGFLLSAAFAGAAFAQTGTVDATNPSRILDITKGFGSAQLGTDKEGDPLITGRIEGAKYSVFFYGCTSGKNCKELQFVASYDVSDKASIAEKLAKANFYNQKKRFGRVYVDDEADMVMDFAVTLMGGVTQKNLDDVFDWWKVAMVDFKKTVIDDLP
jgi:hypothetical protein